MRLTLLYLLAGIGLTALMGAGSYALMRYYFQVTTDQALGRKLALEVARLTAPTVTPIRPTAAGASVRATPVAVAPQPETGDGEGEGESDQTSALVPSQAAPGRAPSQATPVAEESGEDAYDAELAPVFVLPLDAQGRLVAGAKTTPAPVAPDAQAAQAAYLLGRDLRTLTLPDGSRYRLLTYRITSGHGTSLLQAGRSLADQDQLLSQLLVGLVVLAAASTLVLGAGSWWLAGRSLAPAQRGWERQQAFVSNASHELRTPLTLLRASAEVAQRELPGSHESHKLLGDILGEVDHMSKVVDDLLLLSRLDAGRLPLERSAVDLAGLLAEAQRQMGRLAEARGVHLALGAASGAAWGDATRLRQVLLILLDNALRYTPAGGVILLEAHPHGRQVHMLVSDTGSGISPADLPRVFERFYRGDHSRHDDGAGSGLGLALAKSMVEAQQGQIKLESRPGQGTRVTLSLPAASRLAGRRSP